MPSSVAYGANINAHDEEENRRFKKREIRRRKIRKVEEYLEDIKETKKYKKNDIIRFIGKLRENIYNTEPVFVDSLTEPKKFSLRKYGTSYLNQKRHTENGIRIQRAFKVYKIKEAEKRKEEEERKAKWNKWRRESEYGNTENARNARNTRSGIPMTIFKAYNILGLKPTASFNDIRKRYLKLALKYHPNKNRSPGATERFQIIGLAYDKLKEDYEYRTGGSKKRKTKKKTIKKKTYKNIPGYGKRLVRLSKTGKKYVLAGGKKVRV